MAIYLHYEGMTGDVTEEGHKDWIQCATIGFSASRDAETNLGQGGQRQGAEVAISDLTLTKPMDAASPHLFVASLVGFGKKAKIHITRTGQTQQTNYLEVTLEKACVTNYSIRSDGVGHQETLTLNFLKVELKYLPVKEDGSPGEPIPVSFDIAKGEAGDS
jgi:type VI secretion system secreted protein Hcp